MPDEIVLDLPDKFMPLLQPMRYKVFLGGRGSGKSWSCARVLILRAFSEKLLILCTREFQNSIADSVHRVLATQINDMGLSAYFNITNTSITAKASGSEFIFKGLNRNIQEIKSTEGVDICWVEEGQSVSKDSWLILDPTIRKPNSEIWVSFNPENESDPIYQWFVVNPPPNALVVKVGWRDNPWFPEVLERQRIYMERHNPAEYDWVWEGNCRKFGQASIFADKVEYIDFPDPEPNERFFHGADWGFAADPTVLIRCWIRKNADSTEDLMIDREAFGYHTEIDATPALFDRIETARNWPIKADSSRPETISYMLRQGFNIGPADKWQGSVEDGIAHLRGFRKIVIHATNCPNIMQESRLYSYKSDPKTNEVLPLIVDKHNHGWDSVRYALDKYIQARGNLGVWLKLAG